MFDARKKSSFAKLNAICLAVLPALAGFIFTACNVPMGMGKPVDTTPPVISILSPRDNDFVRGVTQGEPIRLAGVTYDDFGISHLTVRLINVATGEEFTPGINDFSYTIEDDGVWKAALHLPGEGVTEYRIRVIAVDFFKNEGADEVTVRVDIVAPWISKAVVIRHSIFEKELKNLDFFEQELNFRSDSGNTGIQFNDIDYFQNEAFNIKLEIGSSFDNVAASRLDVYSEDHVKLNPEPLVPLPNQPMYNPEWRITHDQMIEWDARYEWGAHYIYFVAMAWNTTS
ncbi:MAG: hypothetical protein FWD36_00025 [Treponema sp.]|nr:hypothetical protein [Treponema sp.]